MTKTYIKNKQRKRERGLVNFKIPEPTKITLTTTGLGVGIEQAGESSGPDVRLVWCAGYQVHRLEVVAEDDGESALVRVDADDLLAAQGVRGLALADFLDGRDSNWGGQMVRRRIRDWFAFYIPPDNKVTSGF
ncbi:hypothetical protein PoB_007719900 [Plakobranchus ocellatus]|uniref:Uncharacterized protein n=1 Tax=Plakobranchus ocellatus TaxID=259542 RepID=A0AAV4E2N9_9GAST|nr:hypothetical protein PoB_007719900 [Plakobranchus ocellatus]